MREAAFEIALGRADFAPSLGERLGRGLLALVAAARRRRRATADLASLRALELHRLDDLGLTPSDFADLPPDLDSAEATRRLCRLARRRSLADRWSAR